MASTSREMKHSGTRARWTWRRPVLALLALSVVAAPAVSAGCVTGFDAPSDINGLRVLAVTINGSASSDDAGLSKSYARPGNNLTLSMTYYDGLGSPEEGQRPVQITWIGGCINPIGDQYYGCFPQLIEQFSHVKPGEIPKDFVQGIGATEFDLTIPDSILTRPAPKSGPLYGIAYVFFAACAGSLLPVTDQGTGAAGTFPFGCFDAEGRRLGADSFVPGYTQIYVFEDEKLKNQNPEIQALTMDGKELPTEFNAIPSVHPCAVTAEERDVSGCGSKDPFTECTPVELKAIVSPNVAEADESSTQKDLTEIVWVNYYADLGDIDGGIKLVNDAVKGYNDDHAVKWIPPSEPGVASIWAVVRDARGGTSIIQRFIRIE